MLNIPDASSPTPPMKSPALKFLYANQNETRAPIPGKNLIAFNKNFPIPLAIFENILPKAPEPFILLRVLAREPVLRVFNKPDPHLETVPIIFVKILVPIFIKPVPNICNIFPLVLGPLKNAAIAMAKPPNASINPPTAAPNICQNLDFLFSSDSTLTLMTFPVSSFLKPKFGFSFFSRSKKLFAKIFDIMPHLFLSSLVSIDLVDFTFCFFSS